MVAHSSESCAALLLFCTADARPSLFVFPDLFSGNLGGGGGMVSSLCHNFYLS